MSGTYGTHVFAMDMLSSIYQADVDKPMKPMAFYLFFVLVLEILKKRVNFKQNRPNFKCPLTVWPQGVKTVNELVPTKYLFCNFSNSLAKFYLFKIL